jgi:hypothetical protein
MWSPNGSYSLHVVVRAVCQPESLQICVRGITNQWLSGNGHAPCVHQPNVWSWFQDGIEETLRGENVPHVAAKKLVEFGRMVEGARAAARLVYS